MGDFNVIRVSEERGHGEFNLQGSLEFNVAIHNLTELKPVRGSFMWLNGVGPEHTRSQLDHMLGNSRWLARWT